MLRNANQWKQHNIGYIANEAPFVSVLLDFFLNDFFDFFKNKFLKSKLFLIFSSSVMKNKLENIFQYLVILQKIN